MWGGHTELEKTSVLLLQVKSEFVSIQQHTHPPTHQPPSPSPLSSSPVPPISVPAPHQAALHYSPAAFSNYKIAVTKKWLQERKGVLKFLININ